jgi:hypothetical protein
MNPRKKKTYNRKHESHHQEHDDDAYVASERSHDSQDSRSSRESNCSSHGSIGNYHIAASKSMTSEEDRIPRKKTRFKQVKKTSKPTKQARDRATRRREQVCWQI